MRAPAKRSFEIEIIGRNKDRLATKTLAKLEELEGQGFVVELVEDQLDFEPDDNDGGLEPEGPFYSVIRAHCPCETASSE